MAGDINRVAHAGLHWDRCTSHGVVFHFVGASPNEVIAQCASAYDTIKRFAEASVDSDIHLYIYPSSESIKTG